MVRHTFYLDFKAPLSVCQHLLVLLRANETYRESLSAKPTRSAHSVQVLVAVGGHVIVKNDVDAFNINASPQHIRRHHNARFERLKLFKFLQTLTLGHPTVNTGGWEAILA